MQDIIEYSVTDAALAELKEKYLSVPDAKTEEGYKEIKAGIADVRKIRTSVEKKRIEDEKLAAERAEAEKVKAEKDRLEREAREKQEAEDRAKLEEQERQRIESMRPDIEKITDFAESMVSMVAPLVADDQCQAIVDKFVSAVNDAYESLIESVDALKKSKAA